MLETQGLRGSSLAFIFVGLVTAISFFALRHIKIETTNGVRDSLQIVLQTVMESHQIWVSERISGLEVLANSPRYIALTENLLHIQSQQKPLSGSEPLRNMREFLVPILKKRGDEEFFLIGPDRKNIASARKSELDITSVIHKQKALRLNQAFSGSTTFIPSIRMGGASNFKSGDSPPQLIVEFLAIPVINKNGTVLAVLAIQFQPLSPLTRITLQGRLGETGETYAFDERGVLITESRFDHHLRTANIISLGQNGKRNIRIVDPGGNLLEGYRSVISQEEMPWTKMAGNALKGLDGHDIEGYRDYRGVRVFGAWTWNDEYSFGITTEIDELEALGSYTHTRDTFFSVVTITALLAVSMLYILFRSQAETRKRILLVQNSLEERVLYRTQELLVAKDALTLANEGLEKLAITDSLTGLFNRRYFFEQFNMEWQRCIRNKNPISIIIVDVDYFKPFNDCYGHVSGDECLKNVASALNIGRYGNRPSDLVARYGGEEFILLLSNAECDYVRRVAELIRESVARLRIPHEKSEITGVSYVTVSLGYATEDNPELAKPIQLIERADQALYQAKQDGRNRIAGSLKDSKGTIIKLRYCETSE